MIARQRQNLNSTFALQDRKSLTPELLKSLSTSQAELLDASLELSFGLAQRGTPLEPLERAIQHMEAAVAALEAPRLSEAITAQQQALAALIRARENVRKMLSPSNSSAASSRKFDREQRQKLRLPKQEDQDQQRQLAETRARLEDLAQRERQWSEQAQQACRDSSNASSQGGSAEQRSASELAQDQEKMLAELGELAEQLAKLDSGGTASGQQLELAAESMRQAREAIQQRDGQTAEQEGQRSARQLDQLSEHLSAMHASDLGQRLEEARKLARQVAERQAALADSPEANQLAREQRAVAGSVDMLADQVAALQAAAAVEPSDLSDELEQIQSENPPTEIAAGMRQAADDLQAGNRERARQGMQRAGQSLDDLSQSLGAAWGQYAQPQLNELMDLEEQLAQWMQQMQRAEQREGQAAAAEQKWGALEVRLEALAARDRQLAAALRQFRSEPAGSSPPSPVQTAFSPGRELPDLSAVRELSKVLQTKIQEAILAGGLMDSDQTVPPEYKALVEQYYRELSDDLR